MQVNCSYGVLFGAVHDYIQGLARLVSNEYQIERTSSQGTVMPFLPVRRGVSLQGAEFWGGGCNLKPAVANEEEVETPLS